MKKLIILALALSAGLAARAQTYVPVTLSGFTNDVVADGAGAATASTSSGFDAGNWVLVASNFVNPGNQTPTSSLPANGTINSAVAATPGLTFQLAPYTGNNSLRISGTSSGTLTFTAPRPADQVYLLAASGDGTSTATITVTFIDATTQVFTQTVSDWFNSTNFAVQGISRVDRSNNNIENSSTNPRLYQHLLTISAANTGKAIQSISFNKTAGTSALNVMAVTIRPTASAAANDVAVTSISSVNSGCVLTNQETITVTVANLGSAAQNNIPVSYTINGGTPVSEVFAGPLAANTTASYSFTAKANLATAGTYTLESRTNLTGDALATNDAITKTVTLAAAPAAPSITASGSINFCTGGSVTLTAASSTTGVTYQWFNNGTAIPNATSATYTANATGNYTVSAISSGCNGSPSSVIAVTTSAKPVAPTVNPTGSTTVCNGSSVGLTASTSASGVTFAWFRNGVAIAGATGASYSATMSGEYSAAAVNGGCQSDPSYAILVTVSTPAAPTITQSGAVLTSSSATGNQWYRNGTIIPGATGVSYTPTASGAYTVKYTAANGCSSNASNAISIIVSGIKDDQPVLSAEVYPNPSTGIFNISLPEGKACDMVVTDVTGKVIWQQTGLYNAPQLDLAHAAKGIYILKISGEKGIANHKLLVE